MLSSLKYFSALLLTTHVSAHVTSNWDLFQRFIQDFTRRYDSIDELYMRFKHFENNLHFIQEFHREERNMTLGITPYADMSHEEWRDSMGFHAFPSRYSCQTYEGSYDGELPSSVDWRKNNAVTPVKNQEQCGSCWAFSTTGAVEGAWAISTGNLVSLSEQQLVDCSTSYGNHGCNGGLMDYGFKYIMDNGICTESEYPYKAVGGSCQTTCEASVEISSCRDVASKNQAELQKAVAQTPVSVAIEADTRVFQLYTGGVITGSSCGTNLDHGVLVVGYGSQDNVDYWLVKNSWGSSWGENGYVKIERSSSVNDVGVCGIATTPSFPVV